MEVLIVGNRPLTKSVIELSKNKFIIAADGGGDRLLEFEIIPNKIVGDLDFGESLENPMFVVKENKFF